jgi:hypothetical protein
MIECRCLLPIGPEGAMEQVGKRTMRKFVGRFSWLLPPLFMVACSQQPLSVTMINPKTKAQVKCAARESERPNVPVELLANTVEICVKQLEARGFKRAD